MTRRFFISNFFIKGASPKALIVTTLQYFLALSVEVYNLLGCSETAAFPVLVDFSLVIFAVFPFSADLYDLSLSFPTF